MDIVIKSDIYHKICPFTFSNNADVSFSEIDSGCCGMAGSFGYEKKHYEISETIARSALIPAIEKAPGDTQLIASGFSCRHQIEHFTGKKQSTGLSL